METETAEHRWGERKRGTKSPYLLGGLLDELLDEHGWALARSIRGADEGGEGTMSGRCRAPPHRRTGRIETGRDQRLLTSLEEEEAQAGRAVADLVRPAQERDRRRGGREARDERNRRRRQGKGMERWRGVGGVGLLGWWQRGGGGREELASAGG